MSRVGYTAFITAWLLTLPAAAQVSTPGQINDPSTYRGSTNLQAQEQADAAAQAAANQQMLNRLNQNYAAYAPQPGAAAPSSAPSLKQRPLLPAARNPLLGRWQMGRPEAKDIPQVGILNELPGLKDFVATTFAGGCDGVLGKGMVEFTPTTLNAIAPDGSVRVMNHVEYRGDAANVIVTPTDGDLTLIFGLPNHDHAVVAFLGCTMSRRAANARPDALPVASAAAGKSVLRITVGEPVDGRFTAPPAGTQLYLTTQNPDANLAKIGFAPDPIQSLFAACKVAQGGNVQRCQLGQKTLTEGAIGVATTDPNGVATTGEIAPGHYYIVGYTAYKGHPLVWHLPVDLKPGYNMVSLSSQNGSVSP